MEVAMKRLILSVILAMSLNSRAHAQTLVFENMARSFRGEVRDSLLYQVYTSMLPIKTNQEFNIILRILSKGVFDGSRRIVQTDVDIPGTKTEMSLVIPDDKIDIRTFRRMSFYNLKSGRWENVPIPDQLGQLAQRIIGTTLRFALSFIPGIGEDIGLLSGISSATFEISNARAYLNEDRTRLLQFESEFDIFPIPLDPIPGDGVDYRNLHLGGYEITIPMSTSTTRTSVNLVIGPVRTQPRNIVIGGQAEFEAQNISIGFERLTRITTRWPITAPRTADAEWKGSLGLGDERQVYIDGAYTWRLAEDVYAIFSQLGQYRFWVTSSSGKVSIHQILRGSYSNWYIISGLGPKMKEGWLDTTTIGPGSFWFVIVADEPGVSGDYTLKIISPNSIPPEFRSKPVAMAPDADVPQTTQLNPNFPNPFNPETVIPFAVGRSEDGEHVKLAIYNMLGQEVATLVDEPLPAGNYSAKWGGMDEDGRRVSSGVYFYRLQAGKAVELKKMLTLQ